MLDGALRAALDRVVDVRNAGARRAAGDPGLGKGILFCLRGVVGLKHEERGQGNIPDGPCLIIANHQSTWETLAFLVLFPDVAIIAKEELLTIPVFSWFLRKSPMILIDRESGAKAIRKMIDESRAALDQGRPVLIFPQGSRKSVHEPVEFKRGVEFLYTKLGRPVLPVALNSGISGDRTARSSGPARSRCPISG